jgi:hypothetical protein
MESSFEDSTWLWNSVHTAMCAVNMWQRIAVRDGLVDSVILLRQRHWLARLDTLPFLVSYVILLLFALLGDEYLDKV